MAVQPWAGLQLQGVPAGAIRRNRLRGPEVGLPGRRFCAALPLDLEGLRVGARVAVREEIDDRPGHAVEGAAVGLAPRPA